MENEEKKLIKNTFILGIGQFFPKLVALAILPILTACFTTSEYGIYDLIISFSSLALPIMTLLIQQGVFRYLIQEKESQEIESYISSTLASFFGISLIFFTVFCILMNGFSINNRIFYAVFFLYFAESLYDILGQISRGFGNNKLYSISTIVFSGANLIGILALFFVQNINIESVIIILTIAYLFACLYTSMRLKLRKYVKWKKVNKKKIKILLAYSMPIIPSSISLWVVNLSDRLIITHLLGSEWNGIYAAANKIPNLLGMANSVFNLSWTESASRNVSQKQSSEYYSKTLNIYISFLVGAFHIILCCSPLMYMLLINNKFHNGYNQLPILFLGILFSSIVSFYGGIFVALKKTKSVGFSSIMGAVINIIINMSLANSIGITAASISTVVSFMIVLIFRAVQLKKYITIEYDKKNLWISAITITISVAAFYLNNFVGIVIGCIITIYYNGVSNYTLKNLIYNIWNALNNKKQMHSKQ